MKNTTEENLNIVCLAIKVLKKAIAKRNKRKMVTAYNMVEEDNFSWDHISDSLYNEWDQLTDESNDILNN